MKYDRYILPFLFSYSVLGPALTFRIGPNPKNVTTADLVQVAGERSRYFFMPLLVRLTVIPQTTLHCDASRFQPARPLCHCLRFSKWEHGLVSSDTVDRLLLILYKQTPVPKKIINNSAMTDDHQLQGWWVCRAHIFCPHTHTDTHLQCTGLFI